MAKSNPSTCVSDGHDMGLKSGPKVTSPKEGHKYPVFSVTPQVEAGNIFWDGDGSFGVEETPDMA